MGGPFIQRGLPQLLQKFASEFVKGVPQLLQKPEVETDGAWLGRSPGDCLTTVATG